MEAWNLKETFTCPAGEPLDRFMGPVAPWLDRFYISVVEETGEENNSITNNAKHLLQKYQAEEEGGMDRYGEAVFI